MTHEPATAFDFSEGEILTVYKPYEWTSFDVVKKIKHALQRAVQKKIKIGHAGTLDPLATGLLILCTGKATKRISEFQNLDKTYIGTMILGATTPSFDLETKSDEQFSTAHLTADLLREKAKTFLGEIQQVPPIYSAVKIGGKAAYHKARKGQQVEISARNIFIHEFKITHVKLPLAAFLVRCSKGTYIRSLIHDFGKIAHTGAHLHSLCRTHIGDFSIENCYEIPELIKEINEFGKERFNNSDD